MKKQKISVRGLANIGALLDRADTPAPAPLKSTENKLTRESIIDRTVERLVTSGDYSSQDAYAVAEARSRKLVTAAIRDAFNAGHAQALAQSNAVDVLLERQYASRTMHITPAIVASVMEQLGLSNMVLDMRLVGTVFERNALDFSVSDLGDRQIVDYTMAPIDGADTVAKMVADVGGTSYLPEVKRMVEVNAPTASYTLAAVKKPRAPRKPKTIKVIQTAEDDI